MISSSNLDNGKRVLLVKSRTLFFFWILSISCFSKAENTNTELAVDLYAEANFVACRRECARILIGNPANLSASLLKAVSEKAMGIDTRKLLTNIADSPVASNEISNMARYELARSLWEYGETIEAIQQFKKVFISAGKGALFIRSGCSMSLLVSESPGLARQIEDIANQVETSSSLWTGQIIDECRISHSRPEDSITGKPVQWIIAFYRSQISPAIGSRCSLTPSCSAYGLQALKKHGLLGIAMIGDRAIREPDVVAEKPSPVRIDRRWYYSDPLECHDWWMRRGKGKSE